MPYAARNPNKPTFLKQERRHSPRGTPMPTDHNRMNKVRRVIKDRIAILELKCKDGNASKDEQKELAKLKRKLD